MSEQKQAGRIKRPKLECEKQFIFMVNHRELNEFIEKVYERQFNFVDDRECDDSLYLFSVDDEEPLNDYDRNNLREFVEGNYSRVAGSILKDLCLNGLIKPGTYLIDARW